MATEAELVSVPKRRNGLGDVMAELTENTIEHLRQMAEDKTEVEDEEKIERITHSARYRDRRNAVVQDTKVNESNSRESSADELENHCV